MSHWGAALAMLFAMTVWALALYGARVLLGG